MSDLSKPLTYLARFFGLSIGTMAALAATWIIMERHAELWQSFNRGFQHSLESWDPPTSESELAQSAADIGQDTDGDADAEFVSLVQERDALRVEIEAKDASLAWTKSELQAMERVLATAQGLHRDGHGRQLEVTLKDLKQTRVDLDQERSQHGETRALLEVRSVELERVRARTHGDAVPVHEVAKMVSELNKKIEHAAALVAENFADVYGSEPRLEAAQDVQEIEQAKETVAEAIGPLAMDLLSSPQHGRDPAKKVERLVLRGAIAMCCEFVIGGWQLDQEIEQVLLALYESVREEEDQVGSGRWRALTRRHLRLMMEREQDPDANHHHGNEHEKSDARTDLFKSHLLSSIADILLVFPSLASDSDHFDHFDHITRASIMDTVGSHEVFADALGSVLLAALNLHKIVGEDVTSVDLEVIRAGPGSDWDELEMDADAFLTSQLDGMAVGHELGEKHVLFTTGLGLKKVEKVTRLPGKEAEWHVTTLLKPKVVL